MKVRQIEVHCSVLPTLSSIDVTDRDQEIIYPFLVMARTSDSNEIKFVFALSRFDFP